MTDQATEPPCPECSASFTYADGALWICPQCGHEWSQAQVVSSADAPAASAVIRDANGNPLADGDTVSLIKDLKVKGSSTPLKVGTKVKNITLIPDSADGHNISCRIEGFGAMGLKSEFVKKI